jgi:hypothetical protein
MFRKNFEEKIKTHITLNNFFLKSYLLWDKVGKYLEPDRLKTKYAACALHAGCLKLQNPT